MPDLLERLKSALGDELTQLLALLEEARRTVEEPANLTDQKEPRHIEVFISHATGE